MADIRIGPCEACPYRREVELANAMARVVKLRAAGEDLLTLLESPKMIGAINDVFVEARLDDAVSRFREVVDGD